MTDVFFKSRTRSNTVLAPAKNVPAPGEIEFVFCRNNTPALTGDLFAERTRAMMCPLPEKGWKAKQVPLLPAELPRRNFPFETDKVPAAPSILASWNSENFPGSVDAVRLFSAARMTTASFKCFFSASLLPIARRFSNLISGQAPLSMCQRFKSRESGTRRQNELARSQELKRRSQDHKADRNPALRFPPCARAATREAVTSFALPR